MDNSIEGGGGRGIEQIPFHPNSVLLLKTTPRIQTYKDSSHQAVYQRVSPHLPFCLPK